MAVQLDQFQQVDKLLILTDGGNGVAVTNAAAAVAATTINVVSGGANFATGESFRIGDGEDATCYVVASSTATTVVIAAPGLKKAYASGTNVVEQVQDQYGPIVDGGFKFDPTREAKNQLVATQRLPFSVLKGFGSVKGEFAFPALTLYNLALGLGVPRAKVLGVGTSADWLSLINAGTDFGTLINVNIIVEGKTMDGVMLRGEFYGCSFDFTAVKLALTRSVDAPVNVKFIAGGGMVLDRSASPWVGTSTYVNTSADVLDGLTDFGYFAAHGTPGNTTVASGGAAGTNTVVLASGTGYVAGNWVKFGSGNTVEFHQIETVVTATLTLRTRFLRSQAVGVASQQQTTVTLASITEEGATIEIGGETKELRTGIRELAIGYRPGTASASVTFNLTAFNLTTFALALGLAIPGSTLLNIFSNLGNTNVDGFFAKGLMQGGKTLWALAWGTQMDLSGTSAVFTNKADPPQVPLKGVPLSGLAISVSP